MKERNGGAGRLYRWRCDEEWACKAKLDARMGRRDDKIHMKVSEKDIPVEMHSSASLSRFGFLLPLPSISWSMVLRDRHWNVHNARCSHKLFPKRLLKRDNVADYTLLGHNRARLEINKASPFSSRWTVLPAHTDLHNLPDSQCQAWGLRREDNPQSVCLHRSRGLDCDLHTASLPVVQTASGLCIFDVCN